MIRPLLAVIAAAVAIAMASPASAKTIHHARNATTAHERFYNSTVVPPQDGAQLENPYYAPYYGGNQSSGDFVVGGFR